MDIASYRLNQPRGKCSANHLKFITRWEGRDGVTKRCQVDVPEKYFLTYFQKQKKFIIMISSTIEMLFSVYRNSFLQEMCRFPHVIFLHWLMVLFSCLLNVLISLILMGNYVVFSNARSILELILCNQNLTKFDILTLWSSDCRAWALKLSAHLKKQQKNVFVFMLPIPTLLQFFCTFYLTLTKKLIHI